MGKHYLFVDDSGSKQWGTPYSSEFVTNPPARNDQNRNFWENNYFVLAGLHIDEDLVAVINPALNDAKKAYFGTPHVEIHSSDLRNPRQQKKHYLDKYDISKEKLTEFIEQEWYPVFESHREEIQLQAFVLDKRYYGPQRQVKTCLEAATVCLFDRVELHPSKDCDIVFDQMDPQVRSTQHNQGKMLKVASKEIDLGSYRDGAYSHTSVSFEQSSSSNFLQLADTVAYNVFRQFVDHGDQWEDQEAESLDLYDFFGKIADNFFCHPESNLVKGYGVVKIPDSVDRKWKKK